MTEQEAAAVRAEFPEWQVWRGVNHVWYARRPNTSPPLVLNARDPGEFRQKIPEALAARRGKR